MLPNLSYILSAAFSDFQFILITALRSTINLSTPSVFPLFSPLSYPISPLIFK